VTSASVVEVKVTGAVGSAGKVRPLMGQLTDPSCRPGGRPGVMPWMS
jgi:hypothetical protein